MKGIIVIGTLALAALGIVLLRRKLRPSDQPKVFIAGQNGVPHLTMDADGFVEPPAAQPEPATQAAVPGKFRSSSGVNMGHAVDIAPRLSARPAVSTRTEERGKVLYFPTTQAEKQRLIASRPRKSVVRAVGGGEKVVSISAYRQGRKRR